MQASNFGGTFDKLFLRTFYEIFTEDASLLFFIPWCKKVENDLLCIVISAGIYHLYFASNSSAIIVVPTPISRSVFVSPCILHCSGNLKYLKLRVPCGS